MTNQRYKRKHDDVKKITTIDDATDRCSKREKGNEYRGDDLKY